MRQWSSTCASNPASILAAARGPWGCSLVVCGGMGPWRGEARYYPPPASDVFINGTGLDACSQLILVTRRHQIVSGVCAPRIPWFVALDLGFLAKPESRDKAEPEGYEKDAVTVCIWSRLI